MSKNQNLYEIVTEKILKQLEKGIIPWNKPWTCSCGAVSHTSGRPYSLLNQFLLLEDDEFNVSQAEGREFLTFNQIKAEGGSIRKGEKSKMIVFWKIFRKETDELDEDGNKKVKTIPTLRYYNVWEVGQCEGIARKYEAGSRENSHVEDADAIIDAYFARETCTLKISESDRACYRPISDSVHVPQLSQYDNSAEFYSTLFHEMTHSTGHRSRLNRITEVAAFGSETYSREELVAEFGAAFLVAKAGIDSKKAFRNSAAYIQGWSSALRKDPKLFVVAAGKAEAAVNYILGITETTKNHE